MQKPPTSHVAAQIGSAEVWTKQRAATSHGDVFADGEPMHQNWIGKQLPFNEKTVISGNPDSRCVEGRKFGMKILAFEQNH